MADALAEFYSDSGAVQFTTQSINLVLTQKGTKDFSTGTAGNMPANLYVYLDIVCSPNAILALRPNSGYLLWFIYVERINNNTTNRYLLTGQGVATSNSFTWYVFDAPTTAGNPNNVLIEFYDMVGNITWQLYQNPLRIIDIHQQAITAEGANIQSTADGGRTLAMLKGMRAGYSAYVEGGTPDGQQTRYRYSINYDGVRIVPGYIQSEVGRMDMSLGFTTAPPYMFQSFGVRNNLIVDVTNY
jgi:hypothetical protein